MSRSYTQSNTTTFTLTHAKKLASKVATDLQRMQRFYDKPTNLQIIQFEKEITTLLKGGYVRRVFYGFQRGGQWVEPTLEYTDEDLQGTPADDMPGKVRPGKNVFGARFCSFLEHSSAWFELSQSERESIESSLPFRRSLGLQPGVSGYFESDKTYSAGGRALNRRSLRS